MENKTNMAEEIKKQQDKKENTKDKEGKIEEKKLAEAKQDEKTSEEEKESNKKTEIKEEKKAEELKKEKPKEKTEKSKPKKIEAVVNGRNLGISTKHSIAICNLIRNKRADNAILMLQEVLRMKRAVPMRGEIPHRKGKGMMSGRYPINASKEFIKLLKQLTANAVVNGIELEKAVIECKANRAPRPMRRFGRFKFKRSHILLKLRVPEEKKKKSKIKKKSGRKN